MNLCISIIGRFGLSNLSNSNSLYNREQAWVDTRPFPPRLKVSTCWPAGPPVLLFVYFSWPFLIGAASRGDWILSISAASLRTASTSETSGPPLSLCVAPSAARRLACTSVSPLSSCLLFAGRNSSLRTSISDLLFTVGFRWSDRSRRKRPSAALSVSSSSLARLLLCSADTSLLAAILCPALTCTSSTPVRCQGRPGSCTGLLGQICYSYFYFWTTQSKI